MLASENSIIARQVENNRRKPIYIRVVRRALNVVRASFSPIFHYFSAYNNVTRVFFSPIIISALNSSAMDSSAMDSSALDSSAMDSSTIGVDVAVLVGKCMQGPCSYSEYHIVRKMS